MGFSKEELIDRLKVMSANRALLRERIEHHRQQLSIMDKKLIQIEGNIALIDDLLNPKQQPEPAASPANHQAAE